MTRSACARSFAFAAAFTGAVVLGRLTVMDGTSLSLIWPAAGVAALWFAAQRRSGTHVLDLLLLGGASFTVNLATGATPVLAACSVLANVIQVELFRRLFGRWCPHAWGAGGEAAVADVHELGRLLGAALLATAGGAAVGPPSVWLVTGHWSWVDTAVWMTRNTVSVLLLAGTGLRIGAVLAARRTARAGHAAAPAPEAAPVFVWPQGWRLVELIAALASSATAYALAFAVLDHLPVAFPLLALTMWVALRFDTSIVVLHDLAMGIVAVLLTLQAQGPFAAIEHDAVRALVVQAYVGMVTFVGLSLALGRDERAALVRALRARAVESDLLRARAEQATAEVEARSELNQTVLDAVDVGIVVADPDGRLAMISRTARAWHGLAADAPLDADDHARAGLFAADGVTAVAPEDAPLSRVLRDGSVEGQEIVLRPTGRPARTVVCSGRGMRRADGSPLGAVVVMADVSTARSREAALAEAHRQLAERSADLERSNEELAHFAGVVSHDLNSPLTVISGYLELLLEVHGDALPAEGREWLRTVEGGARRMRDLIEALLRYAATDADCRREPTDLAVVVDRAVQDQEYAIAVAGAVVERAGLPVLDADPVLLRQLVQNLVANAVKYRHPGRRCHVLVSARPDPAGTGGWLVRVSDNGIGIPPAERGSVFTMFRQVDADASGHGIGLATCARIVERHGGRIWAEGNASGGTSICFTLPTAPAVPAQPSGEARAAAPVVGSSSPATSAAPTSR